MNVKTYQNDILHMKLIWKRWSWYENGKNYRKNNLFYIPVFYFLLFELAYVNSKLSQSLPSTFLVNVPSGVEVVMACILWKEVEWQISCNEWTWTWNAIARRINKQEYKNKKRIVAKYFRLSKSELLIGWKGITLN